MTDNSDGLRLKAYQCTTDDPEQTRIVFAASNGAAKFPYAREVEMDLDMVTVRRAPQFDVHSPGPVPVSALLQDGWYFECSNCLRRISHGEEFVEDMTHQQLIEHARRQAPHVARLSEFDTANPRPSDPEPGMSHPETWQARQAIETWHRRRHSVSYAVLPRILSRAALRIDDASGEVYCDTRCEQEEMAKRAGIDHAHAEAERMAEARWPGCAPYESKRWPYTSPYVTFTAPGMQWPVGWRPGEEPHMAAEDRDAWESYLSTLPKEEDVETEAQAA